ncbi:MAG: hypothetical protein AAF401_08660 [Pseudomonadota bacterium]
MTTLGKAGALAAATLVGACSLGPQVSVSAVDYNRAVETSTDKILLLNVVRAAHDKPLHFTRIGKITGNFEAGAEIGSSLVIGNTGAPDEVSTISPKASFISKPQFEIQPLQGKEFVQGLLEQPSTSDIASFWAQGWTKPLLMHLLIEQAVVQYKTGAPRCSLRSNPTDMESFTDFDTLVSVIDVLDPEVGSSSGKNIGSAITVTGVKDLEHLGKMNDAGVSYSITDSGRLQLKSKGGGAIFTINVRDTYPNRLSARRKPFATLNFDSADSDPIRPCTPTEVEALRTFAQEEAKAKVPSAVDGFKISVNFRSVSGVFTYLGELLRAQEKFKAPLEFTRYCRKADEPDDPNRPNRKPDCVPGETYKGILLSVNNTVSGDDAIVVQYANRTYAVPRRDRSDKTPDYTLSALTLAQQFFGLKTEGVKFTTSGAVNLISR